MIDMKKITKKHIKIGLLVLVVILGYLNYYKAETKVKDKNEKIRTSNVTYNGEGYKIEALTQIDDMEDSSTSFEMAKGIFDDMSLSGNNVYLDEMKNLILKNNILGVSVNGWRFNTEEARYDSEKKIVVSTNGVEAFNEEEGVRVSGKNFETDEKMSYITLSGDVELQGEKFTLKADRADYSDKKKIVSVDGNIDIKSNTPLTSNSDEYMTGKFQGAKYDVDKKILTSEGPFTVTQGELTLHGEKLTYDENTGYLHIEKNVYLEGQGYKIYAKDIEYKTEENMVYLNGKIHGGNGIYNIVADNGKYSTETKTAILKGNIVLTSNEGQKIVADEGEYNTITKELIGRGIGRNLVYTSPTESLETKDGRYNLGTKDINLDNNYVYKDKNYESKGTKFYYNKESGVGKITKGDLRSKDFYAKGDVVDFDTVKKYHEANGNVTFEDNDYVVTTTKVIYDEKNEKATVPNPYKVVGKGGADTFNGGSLDYNTATGDMVTPGDISGTTVDYTFKGKELRYNTKTGVGSVKSNIVVVAKKDGSTLTGNTLSFKKDNYVDIIGNVVVDNKDYTVHAGKANYNLKEDKIHIPGQIKIVGKGNPSGTMYDGVFDVDKNIYTGKNFNGVDKTTNFKGDTVKYDLNKDIITATGNVVVDDKTKGATMDGKELEYHLNSGEGYSKYPFTVYYSNLTMDAKRGKYNMKTKSFDGESAVIVSDKDERLEGNQVTANLNQMTVDAIGNVKARVYKLDKKTGKKEKVTYSGENARIYLVNNGGYKVTRGEIRGNGVFKYQNMVLYSDYVEVDFKRNLALGKGGSKMVMDGSTSVISELAEVNFNTEIINLINNVEIESIDEGSGYSKATADAGVIKSKEEIIELEGNVHAENKDSTLEADRGIYNMKSKKFKASGNVYMQKKL